MASTPTGKPRSRRTKPGKEARRRILEQETKEKEENEDVESNIVRQNDSQTSRTEMSESMQRYSLRSSRNLSAYEKSMNASLFYKSILTPSRLKRKSKVEYISRYRTPKIKSAKREYSISKDPKTPVLYKKLWQEQVQNIMNKQWKICYLSSMQGFHYTKKNLKSSYLSTLKIRILEVYPSYNLKVTLNPSAFLYQNMRKTDSLFIRVTSLDLNVETGEDQLRTVYEAMLVRSKKKQSTALSGTDWFPLMLYAGTDTIHVVVVRWLQASFGCYITPRGMNGSNLSWLSAVWTHGQCSNSHHKDFKDRVVNFHYYAAVVSENPKYKSEKGLSIKCTLKFKTVMDIWKKTLGQRLEQGLVMEDVASFHRKLDLIIAYFTKIPRELLSLQAVQTSCNSISRTGKIRITCSTTFRSLLQHLAELFETICHFRNLRAEEEEEDVDSEAEVSLDEVEEETEE